MRLFFGPSIPRQLSLTLVALVSSCLLLVGSFLIVISFTFEIKQLRQIQSVEARIISAEVDGYIDDLQRKIFYLSRIRGLTGFDKGVLQSLLEALINQNKAFELAGMTDRLGNLQLSHSPYGRTIPLDWSATAAFRRSFRGGEDFFGQVELEGLDTQPSLLLSAPIRDAHNAIAGMIFARIRLDYLRAVLDETKKVRGGYAYILDARGLVIGRSGSQSGVFSLDRLTPERLQGIAIDSPENTHSYNGLNGQRVLGQLAFVGSTNWRVLVELPLGEAYAPALRLMRLMGFGLLFGLCASIMLGTVLARRINRPLELLCLAACRAESTDCGIKAGLSSRRPG